jgi:hypothetical protein
MLAQRTCHGRAGLGSHHARYAAQVRPRDDDNDLVRAREAHGAIDPTTHELPSPGSQLDTSVLPSECRWKILEQGATLAVDGDSARDAADEQRDSSARSGWSTHSVPQQTEKVKPSV